ncbi:MAG: N-acetyltransferase [Pseudomonadota bacterium]
MHDPFSQASAKFAIRLEAPADSRTCDALLEKAFGQDRHERLVTRMRRGIMPLATLCFVAHDGHAIHGLLRFYRLRINGVHRPELCFFGPLAIDPASQGLRLGRWLARYGLAKAASAGFAAAVIIGNQAYYSQFGFRPDLAENLILPGEVTPLHLMAMMLEARELLPLCGWMAIES